MYYKNTTNSARPVGGGSGRQPKHDRTSQNPLSANEGEPLAKIHGNRAGLLALRAQIDAALALEEGEASMAPYREADERRYDLIVMRATKREQMGEPREPERPDYSMFT